MIGLVCARRKPRSILIINPDPTKIIKAYVIWTDGYAKCTRITPRFVTTLMVICRPFENLRTVGLWFEFPHHPEPVDGSNWSKIQTALRYDPMFIRAVSRRLD